MQEFRPEGPHVLEHGIGVEAARLANKLCRVGNGNLYQSLLFTNSLYGEPRMSGLRMRYAF